MSLIRLEERPEHSTETGERGLRRHRRVFLGISNNPYDQPASILNSRTCPKVGERDQYDRAAYITSVGAERLVTDEPGNLWLVRYDSSTDYDDEQDLSPLQLPARISWLSEQHGTYTFRDVRGKIIRTAAQTLFPMPRDETRWIIEVEKHLASVPHYLLNFGNVINSGVVVIDRVSFPKHTLMCKGIRISAEIRETFRNQRIKYRTVSFSLHYRAETWKAKAVNADIWELRYGEDFKRNKKTGEIELDKKGQAKLVKAVVRRPLSIDGQEVTEPWPLDKNGIALRGELKPDDLTYIEADVYKPASFSLLPLK